MWKVAPLRSSFMLASIVGFLVTVIYTLYGRISETWGFSIGFVFALMFIAALISMTRAPLEMQLEMAPDMIKVPKLKVPKRKPARKSAAKKPAKKAVPKPAANKAKPKPKKVTKAKPKKAAKKKPAKKKPAKKAAKRKPAKKAAAKKKK